MSKFHLAAAAAALGAIVFTTAPAQAQTTVEIQEWEVPWGGHPRDPFPDANNSTWFVGQRGHYLAHLDAQSGEFTKVDLREGTGPHNTIVGQDGVVWYTGNLVGTIGRYDPTTGQITEIPMPDPAARDPHTLIFDRNGDIWFTVQGGNFIGKLDTQTHDVQLIPSQTPASRPYGIRVAGDGAVWSVLLGTNKLARVDPQSLALTEVVLPREETRPRRLEVTSDGRIWYVDYAEGYLGAHDPATGEIKEWQVAGGANSEPYGMAADSQDRIWFVHADGTPGKFTGFDARTETFIGTTQIPSFQSAERGTVRHMEYHEASGTIWFGTDTGYIGKAVVEPEKAG